MCGDVYRDPRVVPCPKTHTICLRHLEDMASAASKANKSVITCPHCSTEVMIPKEGVSSYPRNANLEKRILGLSHILRKPSSNTQCEICVLEGVQNPALFRCETCNKYLCQNDAASHAHKPQFRGHNVAAIPNAERQLSPKSLAKLSVSCGNHPDKPCELYCSTCEVAICTICGVIDHKEHAVEEITPRLLREHIDAVSEQAQTLEPYVLQHMTAIDKLKSRKRALAKNVSYAFDEIEREFGFVVATLLARKQHLINTLEDYQRQKMKNLDTQLSDIEMEASLMLSWKESIETKLKYNHPIRALSMKKGVEEQVQLLKNSLRNELEPIESEHISFVSTTRDPLLQYAEASGFIKAVGVNPSMCYIEGLRLNRNQSTATLPVVVNQPQALLLVLKSFGGSDVTSDDLKNSTVSATLSHKESKNVFDIKVEDQQDGTVKINFLLTEAGIYTLDVQVNNLSIQGNPITVVAVSKGIMTIGASGSQPGCFLNPMGVAFLDDYNFAVTDNMNHRVQIFNDQGSYLNSFGRRGHLAEQLSNPEAICSGKGAKSDYLLVADYNNDRVQIVTSDGKFERHIRCESPMGVCVDSKNNIYISEYSNGRILVFDWDGDQILSIGSKGRLQGEVTHPCHLWFDDLRDQLLVAHRDNSRIQIFDARGNFVHAFGTQGSNDGEFNNPVGVCMDTRGNIIVADKDNNRIVFYSWDGVKEQYLGKLGKMDNRAGAGEGEFNQPQGVTVDKVNRLFVADSGNHRVQILTGLN